MKKSLFQSLIRIIGFSCMSILGQLLLVGSSYANDELIDVSGTVTSSNGEHIPGVSILVKGTFVGTVTDLDGNYSLNVPNEDDILVFSSIGYLTQEVPLNGRAVIDIVMAEDVQGLDEVVVVGYGTQKKVNVIGS
ncbi:MAG: carboxypeptidase-like regulatory domain-containing protein, partial [Cyclobacteriaceae bacterium]